MEDKDRKLLKFLLYSYFGSPDLNTQNINVVEARKACAHRAYQDLVRTIPYTYSTAVLDKMRKEGNTDCVEEFDKRKKDAVEAVCGAIVNAIGSYTNGENFDEWHERVCGCDDSSTETERICGIMTSRKICNGENLVNSFTFGQAQKWLNMTLKYCWLLNLLPDTIKEDDLHIPVDSYIIDALWCKNFREFPAGSTPYDRQRNYKKPSDHIKPWSKWSKKDYCKFRKRLAKEYNLNWEHTAWIEMAKQRANE